MSITIAIMLGTLRAQLTCEGKFINWLFLLALLESLLISKPQHSAI